MNWQRPFEAVLEHWDRSPALIRLLTFPLIVAIWIPYICVAIPDAVIRIARARSEPPEIKEMSRNELSDWAGRVVVWFEDLQERNPGCGDVLDPPHKHAKTLANLLNDPSRPKSALDQAAKETISELAGWKGLPLAELVWLAKHIEKWAGQNSDSAQH